MKIVEKFKKKRCGGYRREWLVGHGAPLVWWEDLSVAGPTVGVAYNPV
jgi:hypothetical protein